LQPLAADLRGIKDTLHKSLTCNH